VVRNDWLAKPGNERVLTDFLKTNLIAFRARRRLRLVSRQLSQVRALKDATDKMSAATLRPIWEKLRNEVRAWPADGNFSVAGIQAMLAACKAADAIRARSRSRSSSTRATCNRR
jgi:hypothetical protein